MRIARVATLTERTKVYKTRSASEHPATIYTSLVRFPNQEPMRAFVHGTFLRQRTTATTTAATITTHNLGKQAAATTRRNLFFPAMPIGFRRITNDRANSRKARHEALKKKNLLSGPHHKARYSLGRKLFLAYSPRLSYSPWFLSRVFTWFFSFSSRFRPPRTFEFALFFFFSRARVGGVCERAEVGP